ncbi:hypothetical protein HBO38_28025 [Pseudomonas veronii]|uniref:Uncharacterized protein n=1 Tax=Pseudomonas veronii TaxID=76761 RepID=A0A7Y1AAQ4_PSEVE|nr:hypothetical protein [Pseudomonas veronii]NMY12226.1 hypothetical protein [Pseudomonas veronii]
MIADVINFLTPSNEPIQIAFSSIIVVGVLSTIVWVKIKAREKSWEQKWQGKKDDQHNTTLEVEHGSIHELSEAVATTAEKIANIMPGMLLILGLLGTFLGLGLALDKASTILQNSGGASVGAMGSAMQDLTSMMQGLGTKFKTSTWGIIAFILLKIWESINGFEDRRLIWCIGKMKRELDNTRQQQEKAKAGQAEFLQASLMGSAKVIVSALAVQTESMKGEWRRMAEQRLEADQAQNTRWQQNFEQVSQGVIDLTKVVAAVLHNGNEHHTTAQKSLEHLIGIAHSSDQTQAALRQFTESNQDNLAALQKAGTTMGDAALKVSESAGDLQVVVNDLSKQMTEVLNGVKDGLNDTLETMNDDFSENLHKMGSDLEGATDKLSVVMNDVNKSLGTTIRSMSEDLKENLSSMSTNLQKATDNISTSIDSMSESVNAAMNEVAKNMKSTANIQIESSEEFKDISGSLNASVIAMTSMVEKVTKDIKLSLTAVSQSGQRMADLDSRYANVSTMLEQIPDTLKALAAAPERPVPDLKPLQTSLDQLNHAAENIRDALSARQEVEA